MTKWRLFGPSTTGIMCLPRNSAPFFVPSSRQRARLEATSRIPTVIWVGRSSLIGMGLTTGSRRVVTGGSWAVGEQDPGDRIKVHPSTPKPRRRGPTRPGRFAPERSPAGPPGVFDRTRAAQQGKACSPEARTRSLLWLGSFGNTRRSSLNTYLALLALCARSSGEYFDSG